MNLGQALKEKSYRQFGLLGFVSSLLKRDMSNLNKAIKNQIGDIDKNFSRLFLSNLGDEYFNLIKKPLIHNYQVLKQQHGLSFDDYCEEVLPNEEIQTFIYSQYPLLKNQLDKISTVWLKNSIEIITALYKDADEIQDTLSIDCKFDQIERVQSGLGDKHRGGKSVKMVELKNGSKLIYKPRSLSIDKHFSDLLSQLSTGIGIKFKIPKTIEKSGYGWVEYVEYKACESEQEIQSYYKRLGSLLAILYILEATDFHYENIIANGSYPVLIDLESFFHPYFPVEETNTNQGIDRSVLRTGILPSSISLNKDEELDISGLADVEGKTGLLANQNIEFNKNGDIRLDRKKGTFTAGKNIPMFNNEKILINETYTRAMEGGFKEAYLYVLNNKDKFKKEIDNFKTDEIRVLFRNTIVYSHLLEESTHPSFLKNEEALAKHFDWLKIVIPDYKIAARFVEFEIKDLLQRDVPLFSTRVGSKHLWYDNDKYIKDFFQETGYQTVINKIDALSEFDLQQQLWIIQASLSLQHRHNKGHEIKDKPLKVQKSEKKELAERLGQEVKNVVNFIRDNVNDLNDKYANWLVLKAESIDGNKFFIAPSFYDLFTGMPGEILFLSNFGKKFNDQKSTVLANKAYDYLSLHLDQSKNTIKSLGLYTGWGGIISMNIRLAELHKDRKYYDYIERLFDKVDFDKLISEDTSYSLVKGAAGFIVACINYFNNTNSAKALQLAQKAADHLIQNQYPAKKGTGWRIVSKVPLTGMAHGASGFMLAFAKIYKATGKPVYDKIVTELLAYEKSLFSEKHNNWQDCRDVVTQSTQGEIFCSTAWSHGAGGIGLARLELLKLGYDTPLIRKDLDVAVQTVLKTGFGHQHSLTFGDFGNLELLLSYASYFKDRDIETKYKYIVEQLLSHIDSKGWSLGHGNVYTLGIMTGVTGIGYQCLRLLHPEDVPSVLVF